jgi:tRNA(fMet)-specific endonuclease VapC
LKSLALDTNAYGALIKGDVRAAQLIEEAEQIALPSVVLGELKAGFEYGARRQQNMEQLEQFITELELMILSVDVETTAFYAQVYAKLKRTGKMIPTNDIWIAALCLQCEATLYTLDTHFLAISELQVQR